MIKERKNTMIPKTKHTLRFNKDGKFKILMVSDIHPLNQNEEKWNWKMTDDMRKNIIFKAIDFALSLK